MVPHTQSRVKECDECEAAVQGWGLHVWGAGAVYNTSWDSPMPMTGQESASCFWDVPLRPASTAEVGLIVHKGEQKAAGGSSEVAIGLEQGTAYLVHGSDLIFSTKAEAQEKASGTLASASAHWCEVAAQKMKAKGQTNSAWS
jgi:Bacterial pullanase-associated domain